MSWRTFSRLQQFSIKNLVKTFLCGLKTVEMPFYAVARGRNVGIFNSWGDCESQVKGFSGARYKKFDSPQSAQEFINSEGGTSAAPKANNYSDQSQYYPGTSKYNLKRPHSTSSSNSSQYEQSKPKKASKAKARRYASESENDYSDSDDSDKLAGMIAKQMDDMEKRVNKYGKGVDKIISKSGNISGRKAILIEPPQSKRSSSNHGFEEDSDGYVQVYTDGACSSNGRQGARAGLGVYWGEGHRLNTSEPVSGRATNNCGEIQAATCAIKQALENGITKLSINTDSQFLLNSVSKWIPGWKRKGWKLASGEPVKNEIDFRELDSLQHKLEIKWNYVEAHRGIHGNEMADQLAKAGASKYNK